MGIEFILFTYFVGLFLLLYGVYVLIVGRLYMTIRSREPIKGFEARVWGLNCVLWSFIWFWAITWAWAKYSRP